MMPVIDIQILDKRYAKRIPKLKTFCKGIVIESWAGKPTSEISIVLADDAFVHDLNLRYRGKDAPTNVLSFENTDKPQKGQVWLAGDVIIAYDTVEREAIEQEKDFVAHFTHLLIHGVLHLQGFDHIKDEDAVIMEGVESRIMNNLGYTNPHKMDDEEEDYYVIEQDPFNF